MDNAGTQSVVDSFAAVLNRQPAAMRKTMTYDQGREMHGHKTLTRRTGIQIYFADPHSPWQRGSNENTNGLLRQYIPKGSDLSIYSQEELDDIALSLNTRPRMTLSILPGYRCNQIRFIELVLRLVLETAPFSARACSVVRASFATTYAVFADTDHLFFSFDAIHNRERPMRYIGHDAARRSALFLCLLRDHLQ